MPPSRSTSSSPDDKRSCNECLKGGDALEQCEECKQYYHQKCVREEDDPMLMQDSKKLPADSAELKLCPRCKKIKNDEQIKKGII